MLNLFNINFNNNGNEFLSLANRCRNSAADSINSMLMEYLSLVLRIMVLPTEHLL